MSKYGGQSSHKLMGKKHILGKPIASKVIENFENDKNLGIFFCFMLVSLNIFFMGRFVNSKYLLLAVQQSKIVSQINKSENNSLAE